MKHHIVTMLLTLACGWNLGCERGKDSAPVTPTDRRSDHRAGDTKDDTAIETVSVAGNIHMLVGRGGNVGVSVGTDGILIIDDKFAPMADAIRAALKALHDGQLTYVLNTHYHSDHTGGNEVFGKEATIIAHDNVRRHLREQPVAALPVITFDRTLTVHFNGEAIRAEHFANAHTDSDSVIFFSSANVVHMGDMFFNRQFPFVDLNHGGDPMNLATHIRAILKRIGPDTKIIPGHGNLATRADLEMYLTMLDETTALVREHIAAKKTLPEIVAAGVPEKWASWGHGYISAEKWLGTLHTALTRP